jgi:Rhodopirellula transposase DDE domain
VDEKKIIEITENIDEIFLDILKNHTAGSPMEDVKWTNLTRKEISLIFFELGYKVGTSIVKQLLKKHKFSKRQAYKSETYKNVEGRDEQFKNIANIVETFTNSPNNPILSIDVKKKEQIGNFYRNGKLYVTEIIRVFDHDFASYGDGSIVPHTIFDSKRNEAYATLGTSKDTSEFWCDCFRQWWKTHGIKNYPLADCILVTADGGGSNSSRSYVFKEDLQSLANELGIQIRMCHYPPYTSKYNPIEHRVFCHITRACQGTVFSSIEVVKELMNKTSTKTGLKVITTIMDKIYKTGRKVTDNFKENLKIAFDKVLGNWNYVVSPQV